MAFDQTTRNRLQKFVSDTRALLTAECTRQLQNDYGMNPTTGEIADLTKLTHLDDTRQETARLLRAMVAHYHAGAPTENTAAILDRIVREQAFTILNRLCALRMAEARGILIESVGNGYQSKGFQLYAKLAGSALGETGAAYQHYLFSLFDELAVDLAVLFDRYAPLGRLFPRESVLLAALANINDPDLVSLWAEDETIGWIYQYFNSVEERRQMRAASQAPRNSRELAVRNQFFTPRYVVEFLTDNTLGRIWYEMTQGQTALNESCRYLVRRPHEVFLQPGEEPPKDVAPEGRNMCSTKDADQNIVSPGGATCSPDNMSSLRGYTHTAPTALNQPIYIPFRARKDPREMRMLDPACGSMHFGLYAFDLFEQIYAEAWEMEEPHPQPFSYEARGAKEAVPAGRNVCSSGDESPAVLAPAGRHVGHSVNMSSLRDLTDHGTASNYTHAAPTALNTDATAADGYTHATPPGLKKGLHAAYADKAAFLRDVPRLILEHNIHGIDIDPRAVQIAGLSLWLRAQRSWQAQGVKPADRPRIRKANVVCAEPMPGEHDLLREFIANLPAKTPRVLGQLLEIIFDKMQLAGEAGSLLKIEDEIADAVAQAREEWNRGIIQRQKGEQQALFAEYETPKQVTLFDFSDLLDAETFWQTAEKQVVDALQAYAEQAESQDATRRRLFAEDAARGFAFIDLCRQRFDVVLMNPPFGDPEKKSRKYIESSYSYLSNDVAVTFIQRSDQLLVQSGLIGILSPRNPLYLESFIEFRKEYLFGRTPIQSVLDLGFGILDDAMIEVVATVLLVDHSQRIDTLAIVIRLINFNEKEAKASESISKVINSAHIYSVSLNSLKNLQGAPFAYWPTPKILNWMLSSRLLGEIAHTKWGLFTADDFRFLRCWWECSLDEKWKGYFKGGEFSRFIFPSDLVVEWDLEGRAIKENRDEQGRSRSRLPNSEFYFQSGLTFPNTTFKGLAVRALPSDSIFSLKGPGIFPKNINDLWPLMGILNTRAAEVFVAAQSPTRRWDLAQISRIPIPVIPINSRIILTDLAKECAKLEIKSWGYIENSRYFVNISILCVPDNASFETNVSKIKEISIKESTKLEEILDRIEKEVDKLYEFEIEDQKCIDRFTGEIQLSSGNSDDDENKTSELEEIKQISEISLIKQVPSYLVGLIFGRWDIRYATGAKQPPDLPDPFAPLPVCPPGMLQNAAGLPAAPADVPDDYPLRISWPGILVDDEGHPEDIVKRLREALEVIWRDRAGDIEQEACQILGVKTLREYVRKPAKFFADHLKRYSKSRRQAPIYWPLSTASGSYTLWLYYHRLTDQTLYACVNDFVEPKLKQIAEMLADLRRKPLRSSQEDKTLETLTDLEAELQEFRTELLRLAPIWKPNLNDGVQITAAPLWQLFKLPAWQKTLKTTWQQLEKGEFDWAHLAYSLWPERVRAACRKDRSYAIAHGLEDELWEEVTVADKRGKTKTVWQPKPV